LGNFIGYFTAETGQLNQLVHIWGYASSEDRLRRHGELLLQPDWTTFLAQIIPMLQSLESKILNPTSFSPIR